MNGEFPAQLIVTTPLRLGLSILNPALSEELHQEILVRVEREGKFTKTESLYMPVAIIPPVAWLYNCANCTFYWPGTRSCHIVEGIIEPSAWCGLWINNPGDQPFSWLARSLEAAHAG